VVLALLLQVLHASGQGPHVRVGFVFDVFVEAPLSGVDKELTTEPPYVRRELELLVALGAIAAVPQEAGGRRVFYRAERDHPMWQVVDATLLTVVQMNDPTSVVPLR